MNIIRSTAVELASIPALVYKQKLAAGGAGIRMFRLDQDAVAVFSIDKRTGYAVPYGPFDAGLFPDEAIDEALELTSGLPYTSRGKIKITAWESESSPADGTGAAAKADEAEADAEDVAETDAEKADMVGSDEYQAFLTRYTNEKGKINYPLMNKDFIQFASKSKTVADMVASKASVEDMLAFIINNRAAYLAEKKDNLSPQETAALIETLDEIDPRSAFKELTQHLIRLLAKSR